MHIQNILYYNKKIFSDLKLKEPKNFNDLIQAAAAIKKAYPKMYPIGLGPKEKWEAAFGLDEIILEEGGPEYYVKLFKGEVDVKKDRIFRASLEKLAKMKPYIYPFHSNLTWDQSVSLVVAGDSAMVTMGTWAIAPSSTTNGRRARTSERSPSQGAQRYLLFHADSFVLPKGAPNPGTTMDFLRVTASPELQIPCDVVQGGLVARIDIDPKVFPDPIRQEMQAYIRDNPTKLILDQHGSIAPASFSTEYWTAVAGFMAADKPDINRMLAQVDTLFKTYEVKKDAAWYVWP
jgi:ABC-type glycerol-3-phosphate transport system substrate-binding protein